MTNDKILSVITEVSDKLNDLCQDHADAKHEIEKISMQNDHQSKAIESVRISVDKLVQVVYTGNGQPSLTSRVSKVEVKSEENSKTIDEIKLVANEVAVETKRADRKYNAILVGLVGMVVLFMVDAAKGTEIVKFVISVIKGE